MQHYANIKGHAESTFKLPGKCNRGRSWGGTFICVQAEEGVGCAMVKWNLLWRKPEMVGFWGCTFTRLYHLSIFPNLNGTPCPLNCLTTLGPWSATLLLIRETEIYSTTSVDETVQAKTKTILSVDFCVILSNAVECSQTLSSSPIFCIINPFL